MTFEELRRAIENDINGYEYVVPSGAISNPIPSDRVATELAAMRSALVAPYWAEVEIRDAFEQVSSDAGPYQRCAVVADDGCGSLLVFDPMQGDFFLAVPHEGGLRSIGVRGDAVGCFMAR